MSQVAVHKCKDPDTGLQMLLEHVDAIADSIRQRAFDIFQHRDGGIGSDLDDWLQAERELMAAAKQPDAPRPSASSKASLANPRSSR